MRDRRPAVLATVVFLVTLATIPAGALAVDDVANVSNELTDDIESETDGVSDDTDETTDDLESETNETADDIESEIDETADDLESETDDATDDLESEINETVDSLDAEVVAETTGDLEETVNETVADVLAEVGSELDVPNHTVDLERVLAEVTGDSPVVDVDGSMTVTDSERDDDRSSSATERRVDDGNGGDDDQSNATAASDESDTAPSIPGGNAGAGVAIGAGLTGAMLVARRLGVTAALSTGVGSSAVGSWLGSLLATVREWALRFLAIVGYRRFSDDDPLEHETRAALYEQIESSPGSYLSELGDAADVPLQSARYHLRILEFENLVASEVVRGRRRYVPIGTDSAALEAALNDDATAAIVDALATGGPDSVSGLAEALDRDPSTISHHLSRLEADGIVEREREGRGVVNRLPVDVERVLAERQDASTAGVTDVSDALAPEHAD